jgi:hypothetical protein
MRGNPIVTGVVTPDGYTLLIISQTHATNETLVANKPFQLLRDFVPVHWERRWRRR